ncbi:hypothetical protein BKA62DRAFT_700239 [Auriculariales sp. MPI-PUGE-AT-0066]|nr:hypothetical protein BKA62DRAFT_700239 [Auriculariales sp. MPI-PUGE-AT-0066]
MPGDSNASEPSAPISSNNVSSAAEDFKRRRGQMACAECRRLKLKCDRKTPCSSCSEINNFGSVNVLTFGLVIRFVLSNTEHLHEKIGQMSSRISELEDALATLQSQLSSESHPLLTEQLLAIKIPLENPDKREEDIRRKHEEATGPLVVQMGTLVVGDRAVFFGPNAAPDEGKLEQIDATAADVLPVDILLSATSFPVSPSSTSVLTTPTNLREAQDNLRLRIGEYLPTLPVAWKLVELYYTLGTTLFSPMPQENFMKMLFAPLYGDAERSHCNWQLTTDAVVFAMGCAIDLERTNPTKDGLKYFQLARASLALDSIVDHPTMDAIVAIHLMVQWLQMGDQTLGRSACYMMAGLHSQLAGSFGLHRLDLHWGLVDEDRQYRRHLFWEVVSSNCWTSYSYGRPPAWSLAQIDAKLPSEPSEHDDPGSLFRIWNHSFTRNCLLHFMDEAFGVRPITYGTVLRLDRLVREHHVPEALRLDLAIAAGYGTEKSTEGSGNAEQWGVPPSMATPSSAEVPQSLMIQRHAAFMLTQKLILHLHRSFFADAMLEHPIDPLKSKYAQSVLSAFRAAVYISASVRGLFSTCPIALKYWMFTSTWFGATIILGSIVVRSPGCGLAPAAWVEVDRAYELMQSLKARSKVMQQVMPKIELVRARAMEAYSKYTAANGAPPISFSCNGADSAELRFLYGGSRLVIESDTGAQVKENCNFSSAPLNRAIFTVPAPPIKSADTASGSSTAAQASGISGMLEEYLRSVSSFRQEQPKQSNQTQSQQSSSNLLQQSETSAQPAMTSQVQSLQQSQPVQQQQESRSAWTFNSYDVIPSPPPVPLNAGIPTTFNLDHFASQQPAQAPTSDFGAPNGYGSQPQPQYSALGSNLSTFISGSGHPSGSSATQDAMQAEQAANLRAVNNMLGSVDGGVLPGGHIDATDMTVDPMFDNTGILGSFVEGSTGLGVDLSSFLTTPAVGWGEDSHQQAVPTSSASSFLTQSGRQGQI